MTGFLCAAPPEASSGCCSAMQLAPRSRTGTGSARCRDMQTRFRNGLRTFRQCCLSAGVPQGSPCRVRHVYPENPTVDGGECEAARGCSEDQEHLETPPLCRSFVYRFPCHPTEAQSHSRFPWVKPF